LAIAASCAIARAQTLPAPMFQDPQHRFEKPDISALRVLRFTVEDDYPPFGFALPDGTLAGFNVDLARAICEELKVACTVQPRRWDTIIPAIEDGRADAALASLAITPQNRRRVDFSAPYYRTPGRFVTQTKSELTEILPETLAGKVVGVEARTAHEAFLRAFFPRSELRAYDNAAALRAALRRGEVEAIFGDGVTLALWLNGTDANGCCAFRGGPWLNSAYFGEGVGIAVARGNVVVRRALDHALQRVAEKGTYADLYLKYFPIGFF
jgi:polar amino acid transport system substrate-binding protein